MKKQLKLALCGLGLFAIAGLGVGLSLKQEEKTWRKLPARGPQLRPLSTRLQGYGSPFLPQLRQPRCTLQPQRQLAH